MGRGRNGAPIDGIAVDDNDTKVVICDAILFSKSQSGVFAEVEFLSFPCPSVGHILFDEDSLAL